MAETILVHLAPARDKKLGDISLGDHMRLPRLSAEMLERRPNLAAGAEEWNPFVSSVLVATAGLFKYMADEYPPDLPDYDPV